MAYSLKLIYCTDRRVPNVAILEDGQASQTGYALLHKAEPKSLASRSLWSGMAYLPDDRYKQLVSISHYTTT